MNHSIISNTLFFPYNFANLSIKRPLSLKNSCFIGSSLSTIIQLDNNPFKSSQLVTNSKKMLIF